MEIRGDIEWTRRALAVLTAKSIDLDRDGLADETFEAMTEPTAAMSHGEALVSYAVGMANLADILIGQAALLRDMTREEVLAELSMIVQAIEDDLRGA